VADVADLWEGGGRWRASFFRQLGPASLRAARSARRWSGPDRASARSRRRAPPSAALIPYGWIRQCRAPARVRDVIRGRASVRQWWPDGPLPPLPRTSAGPTGGATGVAGSLYLGVG